MPAVGAGIRIFELLERAPPIPLSGEPVALTRRGTVSFESVSFEYPSRPGVRVLKDFNLKLDVGEDVAIVGQSGSGKSSVQCLLLRYYDPVSGRITYDGQVRQFSYPIFFNNRPSRITAINFDRIDIHEFNPYPWFNLIGTVPQNLALFTGPIASNEVAARQANWGMPKGFDSESECLCLEETNGTDGGMDWKLGD
ncbi:P-loop containing nucleoside triphosphate hydrolase protein [Fomitiporia mediterranea MF3/22]|uniref:P-loop containing nucleoside triphosphate hydrolase protein n=1 Tax=Fomitiporia mediterranea (strain MF3/22) TaxID=694068 RepID=UPI00044085C3|nr:P-loop containing nucleoside triphosphate hydrolase protein [Fomitiporia mediterranea MF3/22]EJD08393.1 P-loop containing nucleoside triphosphate hydrolase protein [Fomitiporia mediterranea MF3/22]